jgi:hypothetical protein
MLWLVFNVFVCSDISVTLLALSVSTRHIPVAYDFHEYITVVMILQLTYALFLPRPSSFINHDLSSIPDCRMCRSETGDVFKRESLTWMNTANLQFVYTTFENKVVGKIFTVDIPLCSCLWNNHEYSQHNEVRIHLRHVSARAGHPQMWRTIWNTNVDIRELYETQMLIYENYMKHKG